MGTNGMSRFVNRVIKQYMRNGFVQIFMRYVKGRTFKSEGTMNNVEGHTFKCKGRMSNVEGESRGAIKCFKHLLHILSTRQYRETLTDVLHMSLKQDIHQYLK